MKPNAAKYEAFISYKHSRSQAFAETLEHDLKRYAKPLWRRPIPVFRDEKYLAATASPSLPDQIRIALESSTFLIYLASEEAARSPWVKDELEYWCSDPNRLQRLVIVLTSGDIVADPDSKQIDWDKSAALPSVLRGRLTKIPLYVDLSRVKSPSRASILEPEYRKAVNLIVARLRGIDPAELSDQAIREHRRSLRLRNTALLLIAALAIAFGLAASFASAQWNKAVQREREADSRRLAALSRVAAGEARADKALLLAAHANSVTSTFEARSALYSLVSEYDKLSKLLIVRSDSVTALAFSPGGDRLAAGGKAGSIIVWDLRTGRTIVRLQGHVGPVTGLAFSSDGEALASAGGDGLARTWNPATGKELEGAPAVHHPGGALAVAYFGPTNALISAGVDAKLNLPGPSGSSRQVVPLQLAQPEDSPRFSGAFSPDGVLFAAACQREILIWRVRCGTVLRRFRPQLERPLAFLAVRFTTDGTKLAVIAENGTFWIWDVRSGLQDGASSHGAPAGGLAWSPDASVLYTSGFDHILRAWDPRNLSKPPHILKGHRGINTIAVSKEGSRLATGEWDLEPDASTSVAVWSLRRPAIGFKLSDRSLASAPWITPGLAVSSDGRMVAWNDLNGSGHIWRTGPDRDVVLGRVAQSGDDSVRLVFSPDDRVLASVSDSHGIRLFDAGHGTELLKGALAGPRRITGLCFSEDSKRIVLVDRDGGIRVRTIETAAEEGAPGGLGNRADAIPVPYGGKGIAYCLAGRTLHVVEPSGRRSLSGTVPSDVDTRALALRAGGRVLATAGGFEGSVRLWDTSIAKGVPTQFSLNRVGARVLAFSPDSKILALGRMGSVLLLDAENQYGKLTEIAVEGRDTPGAISFGTNSRFLAFRTSGEIRVLPLELDAWIRCARTVANRTLDPSE